MTSLRVCLITFLISMAATLAMPDRLVTEEYIAVDPKDVYNQVPQKRAALVLDRLLVALQKALREDSRGAPSQRYDADRDGPRTAPLRLASYDANDLSGLQRRGHTASRGRVLRCYFNAVTCF
ncbi:uncharacterized protein LOC126977429 [Leptidea sinapis]|uniref:uncharacterized protein LOC126977429 n=1 Tax=Leptidea sinapis TaxID=189913 RepID=UPI00213B6F49|nr:uncharacterized protein LOC126977429 [Leptidea sinapis]